ncbi:hypothetical protein C0J52_14126 [Blattella germanica]|nr:hypothetical protein C0J52_14126 [Blattella germanica]
MSREWGVDRAPPSPSNSTMTTQNLLLLGPAAHDIPASASQALASTFRDTRVVVMDNGLGILTNSEEEQIDFVDQSGYLFGPSLAATLNNIPTALHWWMEECKLLDGDSSPDCVTDVVHNLVPHLEKLRDEELAERREKRKKQLEEEEAKKRKVDDNAKKDSEEASMEVVVSNDGTSSSGSNNQIRNADIAAAAGVASATENLAEALVDSVLRPVMNQSCVSAITTSVSDNQEDDDAENQNPQQRDDDQDMDHTPVEVRAAPDFSGLATGLLSSLSEILPSVTAAQRALRVAGDIVTSQETESESYPEASYESSYPNSASSLDSTQLGSMLAQSCNTATPAPTTSLNRDEGDDGDESVRQRHAEAEYDSDNSNMNPACGPPPLIPLEEVVNMEITDAVDDDDDEDEEEDDDDDDAPIPYPHRSASRTLLESIRRAGHAPRNLQEAVDMVSFPSRIQRSTHLQEPVDMVAFEPASRLLNEMDDTSDVSGLETVRELDDIQTSLSNGVRHPMNGSESLDLEAATSWLRSQVEARVSQHQREDDLQLESQESEGESHEVPEPSEELEALIGSEPLPFHHRYVPKLNIYLLDC